MDLRTLLFEKPGPHNTEATLGIVHERALALGVKQAVVASSHGDTARQAYALFAPAGVQVIAVSICHGYEDQGWTMPAETKAKLMELGVVVHTGIHDAELPEKADRLLPLFDGTRTLSEIVKEAPLTKFEVSKLAVSLVETGVLVPATAERVRELAVQARVAGNVNLATHRLEVALALDP